MNDDTDHSVVRGQLLQCRTGRAPRTIGRTEVPNHDEYALMLGHKLTEGQAQIS